MAGKQTRPTDVSVVLGYLVGLDDFANKAMILEATRLPPNRLRPALYHLATHKVIDCVVVGKNELWWFATPERDTRTVTRKFTPEGITRRDPHGRMSKKKRAALLAGGQDVSV